MSHGPPYDPVADLFEDFHARGLQLYEYEGGLAVRPKELLTAEDREEIDLWKYDIIAALRKQKGPESGLPDTC